MAELNTPVIPLHCLLHLWHRWARWERYMLIEPGVGRIRGQAKTCLDCGKERTR